MRRRLLQSAFAGLGLCALAAAASSAAPGQAVAQAAPAPTPMPPVAAGLPETFQIGLSTEEIVITSDFNGARLVVFGALDNADGRILRQGGYDIVVVLEGPKVPAVVREKERVLGLWINRGSESFDTVPASYALAATRRLADIAPAGLLEQLSIGIDNLRTSLKPAPGAAANRDEYATALRRIRVQRGLYNQTFGSVEFVSATLFRADLALPANLPVGPHAARAFLFRQGVFLRERSETLWVVKSGFESYVSGIAARHGVLYGLFAVALALLTGWFGRLAFKRD